MVRFLRRADSYHGILPHFLNGNTGKTMPFTRKDDGGDLVETPFCWRACSAPANTSSGTTTTKADCAARINWLWEEAEWNWHTRDRRNVL